MKLPTTKEEMLERFRLFGELFCLCYELAEGDCDCDIEGFKVDFDLDICDVLDLNPDDDPLRLDCGQDDEPDEVDFTGIEVDDSGMVMLGFQGANYPFSQYAIATPSATLQRVLDLLRRYADELNKEG